MINALRFVEELENVGFTPEQAKKSVDTWMSLMNDNFATRSDFREFQLVNKAELREVQNELQNEIHKVRSELKTEIQEVRNELKAEIQEVRTELKAEIQEVRNELKVELYKQGNRLGALMITLVTISTTILSLTLSK